MEEVQKKALEIKVVTFTRCKRFYNGSTKNDVQGIKNNVTGRSKVLLNVPNVWADVLNKEDTSVEIIDIVPGKTLGTTKLFNFHNHVVLFYENEDMDEDNLEGVLGIRSICNITVVCI